MSVSPRRRHRTVQAKLLGAIALGLSLVVLSALAGLGSAWLDLSTEVPAEVDRAASAEIVARDFGTQVQEWKNVLIRGHDTADREKYLQAFRARSAEVQSRAVALAGTVGDPQAAALARTFVDQHARLGEQYLAAVEGFAAAGYDTQAGDVAVRGIDREPAATLEALVVRTRALAEAAVQRKSAQARQTLVLAAIAMLLVAVALIATLAWWVRRSIVRPIAEVAQAAQAVSRGDLDARLAVQSGDEIGTLADSMRQVVATLRGVSAAQAGMAARHEAGGIGYRMDPDAFEGAYKAMVHDTNALVGAQVDLIGQMLETMQRYAIGDLAPDMPRLPGEKARITEAMDATKRNLGAINAEIRRLVEAAAVGEFGVRGDAAAFQHDFRAMVEGLNRLMHDADRNLGQVSSLLQAIAAGDLTARMTGDYHGVYARMREDANATVDRLVEIVAGISEASLAINQAAAELAAGNDNLAERTEQQAASLEETAASTEELTATVHQNAETAREANLRAVSAADVATDGGNVVRDVVVTMGGIETSSRRIAEIISVIDGIAFQTNILALNAAVEAARAGEQGRGFAVVAGEVRALAQRSATAAREIKALIETSVDQVATGSALVERAGRTMEEIVGSVKEVTRMMAEISAASQEQATGIQQVARTITVMDESTQQNAALVEEATAATRSMQDQAARLQAAVSVFHTRAGVPVRAAA